MNLNTFFKKTLINLDCQPATSAYIINVFSNLHKVDLSKDSITLLFADAREKRDFYKYQQIGDWLFFLQSWVPNSDNTELYHNMGRISYYSCYRIVNSWKLYEELADQFVMLTQKVNKLLIEENLKL